MGLSQLFFLFGPLLASPVQAQDSLDLHIEGPPEILYVGQSCRLVVVLEGPLDLLRSGLSQLFARPVELPLAWSVPWFDGQRQGRVVRIPGAGALVEVVLNGEVQQLHFEQRSGLDGKPQARLSLEVSWTPDRPGTIEFPPVAVSYALKPSDAASSRVLGNSPGIQNRLEASLAPVVVNSIPELGRDPAWSGALGRFSLHLERGPPTTVLAGVKLSLQVLVCGEGDPGNPPRWEGSQRARLTCTGVEVQGDCTLWLYSLVPAGLGPLEIPAFDLHVFDPLKGVFQEEHLPSFQVHVLGEVAQPGPEEPQIPRPSKKIFWLSGMGLLLVLAIFLHRRWAGP
jgi:hypothetical protein